RGGSIELLTATDIGVFYGGIFKIVQAPKAGATTELVLQSGVDTGVCAKKTGGRRPAMAARPKVLRLLWANGRGRFLVRGRYASAAVRGTTWLTADRCDGTFVFVQNGSVAV